MKTGSQPMRERTTPVFLTYGFRPFFLGAAAWAFTEGILWLLMILGVFSMPMQFSQAAWHAHEFLFGYLSAAAAGFILTAIPNWTDSLPLVGRPLGLLFSLWIFGRLVMLMPEGVNPLLIAFVDLAMPSTLLFLIGREIFKDKNWKNLPVIALFGGFTVANAVYHFENAVGLYAAKGHGQRLGQASILMLIALIGGRIIPSFTRNWLVKINNPKRPISPMQRLDKITLFVLLIALFLWVFLPTNPVTAFALIIAAVFHFVRLSRWQGLATFPEPLLFVLHVRYSFLPLGALITGIAIAWPEKLSLPSMQHFWMVGAIGLMTLGVMTRAALGQTGRALHAGSGTSAIYILMFSAAILRVTADIWPNFAKLFYGLAGAAWLGCFALFLVIYAPILLRERVKD